MKHAFPPLFSDWAAVDVAQVLFRGMDRPSENSVVRETPKVFEVTIERQLTLRVRLTPSGKRPCDFAAVAEVIYEDLLLALCGERFGKAFCLVDLGHGGLPQRSTPIVLKNTEFKVV